MARFQLEIAEATDKAALFAIHELLFREQISQIWGWDDDRQRAAFEEEWSRVETLVIHDDGGLAGYLQKERHSDHIYVLNLALVPRSQGYGIGGDVIQILKNEAQMENRSLRLSVFLINERALAFYLRHGFQIEGTSSTSWKLHWHG